jgi:hypothetical protein
VRRRGEVDISGVLNENFASTEADVIFVNALCKERMRKVCGF